MKIKLYFTIAASRSWGKPPAIVLVCFSVATLRRPERLSHPMGLHSYLILKVQPSPLYIPIHIPSPQTPAASVQQLQVDLASQWPDPAAFQIFREEPPWYQ
jgi:hypothetical protein